MREKVCKIEDCEKGGQLRRGMCTAHYQAWLREHNPKRCSFEGCEKGACGKGLCQGHYTQQKLGKELTPLREMPWSRDATLEEKIKAAEEVAERTSLGCLIWPAYRNSDGYGHVKCSEYGLLLAHRAAYLVYRGELPKSLPIHHTCGKGSEGCFAVEHLVPVTQAENMAEMLARNYLEGTIEEQGAMITKLEAQAQEIDLLRAYLADMDLRDDFMDWVDTCTIEDLPEDFFED